MEFLNNAIISSEDGSVIGALLTEFNPDVYTSRAKVKLYTVQELEEKYPSMTPRGFAFSSPGKLLSDTNVTRAITSSVFSYMEEECSKLGERNPDLTDLVLRGVKHNASVYVDFAEMASDVDVNEAVDSATLIPFKTFRVSNSSFNIYAPYQAEDGKGYRTFSLLNLEDGSMQPFYAMFQSDVDMSDFGKGVTPCQTLSLNSGEFIVYKVELGLNGFYASVGEAFLNFLAYNVSFHNIGEKLMKEMKTVMPQVPAIPTEEAQPRIYRKAKVNVSIEHIYKDSRLKGIVGRTGNTEELIEFMKQFPEAAISYQWLQRIYQSPWYIEGEGKMSEEECIYTSCINLLSECKQTRLKYALELLTHRYYIYMLGVVNDTLGAILKGGGVSGEAIKRVSF